MGLFTFLGKDDYINFEDDLETAFNRATDDERNYHKQLFMEHWNQTMRYNPNYYARELELKILEVQLMMKYGTYRGYFVMRPEDTEVYEEELGLA